MGATSGFFQPEALIFFSLHSKDRGFLIGDIPQFTGQESSPSLSVPLVGGIPFGPILDAGVATAQSSLNADYLSGEMGYFDVFGFTGGRLEDVVTPVPEPLTLITLLLGMVGLRRGVNLS